MRVRSIRFLQRFTEPALTGPIVKPYTREHVEALLNQVRAVRLARLLRAVRVSRQRSIRRRTNCERAGWRFAYTAKPNEFLKRGQ